MPNNACRQSTGSKTTPKSVSRSAISSPAALVPAATHVIFQDLDWVPANHLQAEDRAYRMGQTERVTVEYMLADGTLDVFIADLLEAKLRMINAVEADETPNASALVVRHSGFDV